MPETAKKSRKTDILLVLANGGILRGDMKEILRKLTIRVVGMEK